MRADLPGSAEGDEERGGAGSGFRQGQHTIMELHFDRIGIVILIETFCSDRSLFHAGDFHAQSFGCAALIGHQQLSLFPVGSIFYPISKKMAVIHSGIYSHLR